jgi:multimeric flavodoxin WrbA
MRRRRYHMGGATMKVLAVVGSPRKRGNTDVLVDAVIRGATDNGAEVERVFLAGLDIKPCDACDACRDQRQSGRCVVRDDMTSLYEKLFASDAWVLGTPIYWWGPSAQLKAFVDRWYAFSGDDERQRVDGKRAALVAAFEDSDPATARHTVGMLQDTFDYLRMDFVEQVLVTAGARGEVTKNQAALDRAYALGKRLAAQK